ncbi:hypothetical protein HHK36_002798 [Tetracentron sinense]|uniref:NPH3 domain-containing protein n=1 Tax=Tetracentron sinense TaxID=13715 RepID=A0A834ZS70_TETSI|nr:hypothetical protein HHK36_002798 [Tetracentron sinense]
MYEGTRGNAKMRVARLVDSYLTEVSKDRNLSLTKFQVIAEALPESARTCDDGLYRAVYSYLKDALLYMNSDVHAFVHKSTVYRIRSREMCYAVRCSSCGKSTWAGCGRHVASVYRRIEEGQHCLCREWPGVKLGDPSSTADESQSSSTCAIL